MCLSGKGFASTPVLTLQEANRLVAMPLHCAQEEYPNKLNQVLDDASYLKSPKALHPAFYGCFDWHSSVHGHWMMVSLLRHFPELANSDEIRQKLKQNLTAQNIQGEIAYFSMPHSGTFERTYGWAWLLKLAEELDKWDDPLAKELAQNLQPLTALIVTKYSEFLPKLVYPNRTGEHPNTAFALSMAYDFALQTDNQPFADLLSNRAKHWYGDDKSCPLSWEPNGFDFLSPCFEELDVMRKVLAPAEFTTWADNFLPGLSQKGFELTPAKVSDRTDGKLIHLDGLNFSRGWVLYGLISEFPERYGHLQSIADTHVTYSLPAIVDGNYEGTHWLGSFAVYALQHAALTQP
ncbi:DUF2891 domain-containing protein [Alteromonas sp. C1M14]|uniref:DUF2891 domain-containing protein n=1 Tax=Alteromonas sp. C1M14 TaxID=2841567 RepID=UPI001C08F627|nr:DUF2891 domain-containing protein [Alteromonas sp. C1M14]MBU2977017.1 DUF2891 domain-containing protein [Alteromonas sp. C1M14]